MTNSQERSPPSLTATFFFLHFSLRPSHSFARAVRSRLRFRLRRLLRTGPLLAALQSLRTRIPEPTRQRRRRRHRRRPRSKQMSIKEEKRRPPRSKLFYQLFERNADGLKCFNVFFRATTARPPLSPTAATAPPPRPLAAWPVRAASCGTATATRSVWSLRGGRP